MLSAVAWKGLATAGAIELPMNSKRRPCQPSDASVAAIIVNYRTPDLTQCCLAALKPERDLLPKLKVVVVEGGSQDHSAQRLAEIIAGPQYRDWVTFLPLAI